MRTTLDTGAHSCHTNKHPRAHPQATLDAKKRLRDAKRVEEQVGTGCQCQGTPSPLESTFLDLTTLPKVLIHLILEYIPPGTPSVVLSDQQANVIRLAARGESVFFTGKAGTGKSLVLQKLVELEIPHMYFTALTGVAATHIQGQTKMRWLLLNLLCIPVRVT